MTKTITQVGKDIEPDAVGRKFEPYLTAGCVGTITAPVWCGLRVKVIKAATAETPGTGVKLVICAHGKGRRDLSAEHSMRITVGYGDPARGQAQEL